ncbi:MAG TPA: hypothetical protein VHQ47_03620 [Phycisphaerae bacterium]|nr:hypothetical protein [Phycisphaerae bacterium]
MKPSSTSQKLFDKDRTGNVPSPAPKSSSAPAVDANEEEGSSAQRPGNSPERLDARTDESGASLGD